MTVAELIEKLKTMDQNALVVHRGYEDGYDPANDEGPCETVVYPRIDAAWYNGAFDTIAGEWTDYDTETYDKNSPTTVVII